MRRYKASGSAYNVDLQQLKLSLNRQYPEILIKPRIFGYDIELLTNSLELFINTTDESVYFITIDFIGSEKELIARLEDLINVLATATSDFDLGYYETNEEGNQISEDILLKKFPS